MAGQRQLTRGGENAQARQRAIIRGPLDENGFRKIHFARDGLHFRGWNAVAIGDDRQWIPGEAFGGEYIERIESAIHMIPLSGPVAGAREIDDSAFCRRGPEKTRAKPRGGPDVLSLPPKNLFPSRGVAVRGGCVVCPRSRC